MCPQRGQVDKQVHFFVAECSDLSTTLRKKTHLNKGQDGWTPFCVKWCIYAQGFILSLVYVVQREEKKRI